MDLKEPLSAFFGAPVVNLFLLLLVWSRQHFQISSMSWCSFVSLTTLALSFCLQLFGMILTNNNDEVVPLQCKIAYLSTVLQIVAASSLLLFHTVVVLPLLLMVLTLVAVFWWQTFHRAPTLGVNWGQEFKEQLKHHFDLSSRVVSLAFAGLSGTVKGPSHQKTIGGYMPPAACFLFYAAVFGLLVALLCTVPTRVKIGRTRSRMAKAYLPILAYASLLFLVLAGVMAAEEILREYVFLACFAFVLLAMVCFLLEYFWPAEFTNAAGEVDVNISKYLLPIYFVPCFLGLMATRLECSTGSGRTVSTSWWLKGFVLSELCAILIYAVRMVVFMALPGMQITKLTKTVWILGMYLSIAGTLVCFVVDVLLHGDEVKNIIF